MRSVIRAAAVLAVALVPTSLRAQGSPALEMVARAMGGKDRVLAVRTIVLEGPGDNFNLGQNLTPDAPLPRYEVTQSRRAIDFESRRWQLDQTREPRFVTGNTAPQRQRFGIDGDVAYNIANDGAMARAGGQAAADRANELVDHPIGFLQTAFAADAQVTDEQPRGNTQLVRLTSGGDTHVMIVDLATMLPLRTQRTTDNVMLGDIAFDTDFADWRDVDGVKLPMRVSQKLDGRWVITDMRYTAARVNADVGDLTASPELGSQAPAAPVVNVTVEDIAPGVWYLNGQTHHSVAIETANDVVLVEAPQNDARTLAVIEKARSLRPDKPVTLVINTHHHFDHAGGVRAAISQGLTVLTQQGNRDFYERSVFPRRHGIAPDALMQNRKPLRMMIVGDKYVRRDSLRTLEVYRVDGSQHSGTMLMVYLPTEKLLIEADLYSPPAPNATAVGPFPFAANLLENIQRRGLQVERIVPIHGRVIPLSDLQAATSRAP